VYAQAKLRVRSRQRSDKAAIYSSDFQHFGSVLLRLLRRTSALVTHKSMGQAHSTSTHTRSITKAQKEYFSDLCTSNSSNALNRSTSAKLVETLGEVLSDGNAQEGTEARVPLRRRKGGTSDSWPATEKASVMISTTGKTDNRIGTHHEIRARAARIRAGILLAIGRYAPGCCPGCCAPGTGTCRCCRFGGQPRRTRPVRRAR
jgi:hypothetical protein